MKEDPLSRPREGGLVILTGSQVGELHAIALALEGLARAIRDIVGPESEDPEERLS